MPRILAALCLIFPALSYAGPCEPVTDDDWKRNRIHNVEYRPIVKKPGDILNLGGKSYVMTRLPFREFASDDRYAITYPVLVGESRDSTSTWTSFYTEHRKGPLCNDVWIEGTNKPSHKLPIGETRYVQHRSRISSTDPGNNSSTLIVQRQFLAYLRFQIGQTRSTVLLQTQKIEIPEKTTPPGDYDLTSHTDWEKLGHVPVAEINHLKTLMKHVYITPLDG